ncbi:unnamed protein product [Cochlearia groenlandica]
MNNDLVAVEKLFEAHKGEIVALLLLDPLVGNSGFITLKPEFIDGLRRITKDNGCTSYFRLQPARPMYQAGTLSGNPGRKHGMPCVVVT